MFNAIKIRFFQNARTKLGSLIKKRKQASTSSASCLGEVENVEYFKEGVDFSRKALIMLYPDAWLSAVEEHPDIKLYNHTGFVYSIVKALNLNGYSVDLIHPNSDFKVEKDYDVFIGHGAKSRKFVEQLSSETIIYQYISGLYYKVFNKESDARYERFKLKYNVQESLNHNRSMDGMHDGLEFLNDAADVLFTINCPRMCAAYGQYSHKFYYTGLGAYLDPTFVVDEAKRDFDKGRKNFIYVGGTKGNLQKGLDLLIEAFSKRPDLNLYIYCKVEEEIMTYCKKELRSKNIHYIYHWRFPVFEKKLRKLLMQCNFSVHAPINIGMGTAFMATLGLGMIPVGYLDINEPSGDEVLSDDWSVDSLIDSITKASQMPVEWCAKASKCSILRYEKYCDPQAVEQNFIKMFSAEHVGKTSLELE